MNWQLYALMAAVMLAAADLSVKAAAGRITNSLGLAVYGGTAFVVGLLWCGWRYWQGKEFSAEPAGMVAAISTGITFALVTVGLYLAFEAGAPISRASPAIRTGGLLIAAVVGLTLLEEPITPRYLIGIAFCLAGLYLIIFR